MVHLLVLTTLALSSAAAAPKAVEWQSDYGKALEATRADDRPLLVVLDVPGDEKKSVETDQVKPDGEQADLLAKYQLCRIDASTEYGKRVAEVFKANKFPFTAIIDKTGSVVLTKKQGQLTDDEWNQTLKNYKSGERSSLRYTSAYRGLGSSSYSPSTSSTIVSPSYCPSCQRNAQRNF